jgi:hypothetical protein
LVGARHHFGANTSATGRFCFKGSVNEANIAMLPTTACSRSGLDFGRFRPLPVLSVAAGTDNINDIIILLQPDIHHLGSALPPSTWSAGNVKRPTPDFAE